MPAMYEAVRDKFLKQGMASKEAKTRAAKIFNAHAKKGKTPSLNYYIERERRSK